MTNSSVFETLKLHVFPKLFLRNRIDPTIMPKKFKLTKRAYTEKLRLFRMYTVNCSKWFFFLYTETIIISAADYAIRSIAGFRNAEKSQCAKPLSITRDNRFALDKMVRETGHGDRIYES